MSLLIIILCYWIVLIVLDVTMDSPPHSPSDLQGASCITGGILDGQALGNVYNFADGFDLGLQQGRATGKVLVYSTCADPKPHMSLKHEVTSTLGPVLTNLGARYSPVKSMC